VSADELAAAVAELGALPMPVPVGPEPLSAERLTVLRKLRTHCEADRFESEDERPLHVWGPSQYPKREMCQRCTVLREWAEDGDADEVVLVAEVDRLSARVSELEHTVQQMVDGLNGHDCPPPGESPMGAVTRFAVRLMEAERLLAEDGCSCPPVDRTHQIGCPLDGVPVPGPDAVTASFAERAERETDPARRTAWRMLAQDVTDGEHYGLVHHDYRVSHDLPETGDA
jgi:hypothetical protein